jgi:hypothetical protein
MADIGNRAPSMRLQCKRCGWVPPEDMTMRDAQLHFQVEHDTDEVKFDLVAVCTCGEAMTVTDSHPTGGGIKDYLLCGVCGNTGHLRRDA